MRNRPVSALFARCALLLISGVCLLLAPSMAQGQAALAISAGPAPYDLSGTGTSAIAAVRADIRVAPWIDLQAGPAFFWYETQGDQSVAMLIPEVGVVVHVPGVPIYLAAGVGHTLVVQGASPDEFTLYAGMGAHVGLRDGWGLRPEFRLHSVDPWTGSIGEFGLAVRRTFGAR